MTAAVLRRAIHAASGAVVLLIHVTSPIVYRPVFLAAAVVTGGVDVARARWPAVHDACARFLPVFRPIERRRLSGATWLLLGYAIATLLPARAAMAGILVAALADPAAAMVGERLGGGRAKSWPGTAAALATALGSLMALGLPPGVALAAGAVGAAAERWSGPLDDNVLTPPVVGATVALLA